MRGKLINSNKEKKVVDPVAKAAFALSTQSPSQVLSGIPPRAVKTVHGNRNPGLST